MVGLTGLDEDSTTTRARADNARGANKQCHRFFGGPITRSKKFLVEIQKGNDIGFMNAMQRGLGTNNDSGSGTTSVCTSLGRHLGNRFTGQRFEFFTHSIDASAEVLHLRTAALRAQHRPNGVAPQAH